MSPVRVRQEALFAAKSFLRRFCLPKPSDSCSLVRFSFHTTSQSGLRPPAPLVGEPLAKPFTLRGLPRPPLGRGGGSASALTERFCPLSCNQTVAFFTLFSKIKGKLKNVLLKKWRICVTLHPSCNGIFGDSGVFSPVFFGSEGRRQSDYHAFFLLFCPFWLFFRPFSLVARGKVW